MTRPERYPQRTYVHVLKLAIDRAREEERRTRFLPPPHRQRERLVREVLRLISENPQATRSSHVMHNLGPERRLWLHTLTTHPEVSHGQG